VLDNTKKQRQIVKQINPECLFFIVLFVLKLPQFIVYCRFKSMNLTSNMKFQTAKLNRNLISLQGLMGLLMTIILSGCSLPFFSGYGANGQTREEFSRYVEEVFKLQNRMTSKMMAFAEEDEKPTNLDTLLQAEQRMHKNCEALNEYAERDSDGLSVGLLLQRRVEQTAVDCEKAAKELQTLLKSNIPN
jgi:hypothetical protein